MESKERLLHDDANPLGTTPIVRTKQPTIDTLTLTAPESERAFDFVRSYLECYGPFEEMAYCRNGFKKHLKNSACHVYRHGPFGVMVIDFKGNGLREVRRHHFKMGGIEWRQFIDPFIDNGFRISRIDVAFDFHGYRVPWTTLKSKIERHEYTSAFTTAHAKYVRGPRGKYRERSVFIGDPDSGRCLRIYDAALKHRADHPWLRVELQARNQAARDTYATLIDGGFPAIAALVKSSITFRNPLRGDSNRCRWPKWKFWDCVLFGDVQGMKPRATPVAQRTPNSRTAAWLLSLARSIARVYDDPEYGEGFFQNILARGRSKAEDARRRRTERLKRPGCTPADEPT